MNNFFSVNFCQTFHNTYFTKNHVNGAYGRGFPFECLRSSTLGPRPPKYCKTKRNTIIQFWGSYHLKTLNELFCFVFVLIINNVKSKNFIKYLKKYSLWDPQKSSVNVFLIKKLKSTVTKIVIVCFNNLGEENF